MRKRARSRREVTCAACRNFDGQAWCRRWNFHTDAASPICDEFRAGARPSPLGDVPPLGQDQ